jgi:integrase/recombinase XerD
MPRNPRYLTHDEVVIILKHAPLSDALGVSIRLMLFAGLRIQETSKITRSDIKRALQTGMFSVRKEIAKYNHPRTIPVCISLAISLQSWVNKHDSHHVTFLSLWSCSMRTVQRRFAEFFSDLCIQATPHDIRHTFATALYHSCRDLGLIQATLGHRDLKSTMVYVHCEGIIQEEIEEAYNRFKSIPPRKTYNAKKGFFPGLS